MADDGFVGPMILDGWLCDRCRRYQWPWMRYCGWCRVSWREAMARESAKLQAELAGEHHQSDGTP